MGLEDLVKNYTEWQKRLDELEAQRPKIHAEVLSLQQAIMEGEGQEKAFEEAKAKLQDHDLQIEAAVGKLRKLWVECFQVGEADIMARRAAKAQTQEAFDQEFREKSLQAANLFAQALEIIDDLGIDKGYLARSFTKEDRRKWIDAYGSEPTVLLDEISHLFRPKPLNPGGSTFKARLNDFKLFITTTGDYVLRMHTIYSDLNRMILDYGGRRVLNDKYNDPGTHEPRKEAP